MTLWSYTTLTDVAVGAALQHPAFVEAERRIDLSAAFHRIVTMRLFEDAGLDPELAEALYEVEWEPDSRPVYPDAPEALAAIHARGAKIAVVSDIYLDIVRPDCGDHRIDWVIDVYVLSCELGVQKPDSSVGRRRRPTRWLRRRRVTL